MFKWITGAAVGVAVIVLAIPMKMVVASSADDVASLMGRSETPAGVYKNQKTVKTDFLIKFQDAGKFKTIQSDRFHTLKQGLRLHKDSLSFVVPGTGVAR